MFNPQQFLNTEINAGFSIEYIPVPDGEWGPAQCTNVNIRQNKTRTGDTLTNLDTTWEIMDSELLQVMEIDRNPAVRYSIILDFDEDGQLKRGKNDNVRLGRLLAACGMNDGPLILGNLKGQTVSKVRTATRFGDDGTPYVDVKDVIAE